MRDTDYNLVLVPIEHQIEEQCSSLNRKLQEIVATAAARGFSQLQGPTIGAMARAILDAMDQAGKSVFEYCVRGFTERPMIPESTERAISEHLEADILSLFRRIASQFRKPGSKTGVRVDFQNRGQSGLLIEERW